MDLAENREKYSSGIGSVGRTRQRDSGSVQSKTDKHKRSRGRKLMGSKHTETGWREGHSRGNSNSETQGRGMGNTASTWGKENRYRDSGAGAGESTENGGSQQGAQKLTTIIVYLCEDLWLLQRDPETAEENWKEIVYRALTSRFEGVEVKVVDAGGQSGWVCSIPSGEEKKLWGFVNCLYEDMRSFEDAYEGTDWRSDRMNLQETLRTIDSRWRNRGGMGFM